MCGINGIFAYGASAERPDHLELLATRDHMRARGPDGCGAWWSTNGQIGLGHRRLSIIDLNERAAQPMHNDKGNLTVVYNGEIYNFREIRRNLEAKGYRFRTESDTEVLLHLYAAKGAGMVHDLRGMFALAIWDAERSRLFIARDPYGIKPLYYADTAGTFRFASQVKALMAGGKLPRDVDPAGLVGFYLWGSVPEPHTTWSAVRALPAGCHMTVDANGVHALVRYHSVAGVYAKAESTSTQSGNLGERFAEALQDSVRNHMVSDVPIGAFLSAGIDSGALVGLMRDAGQSDIRTVTLSFSEFVGSQDDEAPLADQVARYFGTNHTNRVVTEAEFQEDLPMILNAMDQPTVDGINSWFVSKSARELGLKVAISGLGGDELFGGYPSFRDVPRMAAAFAIPAALPGMAALWRSLARAYAHIVPSTNPKFSTLLELGGSVPGAYLLRRGVFAPSELFDFLDTEFVHEGLKALQPLDAAAHVLDPCPQSNFAKIAVLESSLYMRNQLLRDTDWASMAHSLEVRVPLVDAVLLSQLAPCLLSGIQHARPKAPLAAAPSRPLPDAIVKRPKTGFSTPIAAWLQRATSAQQARTVSAKTVPWARRWVRYIADVSVAAPQARKPDI